MEPTDSNDNVPLSRDECGDETHTEREQAEGLASLQWQREEGGRMSRRETGRRTPTSTPHRLAALQEATARAGEDSDDDERRDVEGALRRIRRAATEAEEQPVIPTENSNQQMGAPPGAGVPTGSLAGANQASTTPRRQLLSPFSVGQPQQPPTDYMPFTPLQQPAGRPVSQTIDAADATFLDDDFQECWWCTENPDGSLNFVRGWATKQGERALVYIAGGGLWAGAQEHYRELHRRVTQEVRVKRETGSMAVSRRYEAARKGASEYLRRYRCETGSVPSKPTWASMWRGGRQDAGGRQITAELCCASCRAERTVSLASADSVASAFLENGFRCSMLQGVTCNDRTPLLRGTVLEFALSGARAAATIAGGLQASTESANNEVSRDGGESDDVELVGFSTAAKQFYKARGP